jgi:hypothetical protein
MELKDGSLSKNEIIENNNHGGFSLRKSKKQKNENNDNKNSKSVMKDRLNKKYSQIKFVFGLDIISVTAKNYLNLFLKGNEKDIMKKIDKIHEKFYQEFLVAFNRSQKFINSKNDKIPTNDLSVFYLYPLEKLVYLYAKKGSNNQYLIELASAFMQGKNIVKNLLVPKIWKKSYVKDLYNNYIVDELKKNFLNYNIDVVKNDSESNKVVRILENSIIRSEINQQKLNQKKNQVDQSIKELENIKSVVIDPKIKSEIKTEIIEKKLKKNKLDRNNLNEQLNINQSKQIIEGRQNTKINVTQLSQEKEYSREKQALLSEQQELVKQKIGALRENALRVDDSNEKNKIINQQLDATQKLKIIQKKKEKEVAKQNSIIKLEKQNLKNKQRQKIEDEIKEIETPPPIPKKRKKKKDLGYQLEEQIKEYKKKLESGDIQTPEPKLSKKQRKTRYERIKKKEKEAARQKQIDDQARQFQERIQGQIRQEGEAARQKQIDDQARQFQERIQGQIRQEGERQVAEEKIKDEVNKFKKLIQKIEGENKLSKEQRKKIYLEKQNEIIKKLNIVIDSLNIQIKEQIEKPNFNSKYNSNQKLSKLYTNFNNENNKITKNYKELKLKKIEPFKQIKLMEKFLSNLNNKLDLLVEINNLASNDKKNQNKKSNELKKLQSQKKALEVKIKSGEALKKVEDTKNMTVQNVAAEKQLEKLQIQTKGRISKNNDKLRKINKNTQKLEKKESSLLRKQREIQSLKEDNEQAAMQQAQEIKTEEDIEEVRNQYNTNQEKLNIGESIIDGRLTEIDNKKSNNQQISKILEKENKELYKTFTSKILDINQKKEELKDVKQEINKTKNEIIKNCKKQCPNSNYLKTQLKKGLYCDETSEFKIIKDQGDICAEECKTDETKSKSWKKAGCSNPKILNIVRTIKDFNSEKATLEKKLKNKSLKKNKKKHNELVKKISSVDRKIKNSASKI